MSILQYPDTGAPSDLQIWNNAAFDNGDPEDLSAIKSSWSHLKPILDCQSDCVQSDCSKENQNPVLVKSAVAIKSPSTIKPLHPNGAILNSQGKPMKNINKQSLLVSKEESFEERNIDTEIEEIEKEISRLSLKLETLRVRKAENNKLKTAEKRGRIVAAKFMEQKQSVKNVDSLKKVEEEPSSLSGGSKLRCRSFSLGPSEIVAGVKLQQLKTPEITPFQPIQDRRKSCFWKLHDIDEEKVRKESRNRRLSLSTNSRKENSKIQVSKQAVTTMGGKQRVKKDDGVLSLVQPKKLFIENEKSVSTKKPMKTGRVVASRYSHISTQGNSAMRKRSLPEENEKEEEGNRYEKKRSSSVGKSRSQGLDNRVKKRWEIPAVNNILMSKSPTSITKIADILPKIRTARYEKYSPRDSGPAKRVAELIGRKSYFGHDEEVEEPSVCQALSFVEEDDQENQIMSKIW